MNENHHADKSISDEIDAVLRGGKSNNEMLRALHDTTPQAETAFRENLEEQLMAHLQNTQSQTQTEDEAMKLFKLKQKRANRSSRLPLTMAAAVIAIAVIGGLLFFVERQSDQAAMNSENAAQAAASPENQVADCEIIAPTLIYTAQRGDTLFKIASDFGVSVDRLLRVNCMDNTDILEIGQELIIPSSQAAGQVSNPRGVVVANTDIAYGDTITEDMIRIEYFADRDINAVFPFCCEDYVVGRIATEPIRSGTIIEERMLGSFDLSAFQNGESPRIAFVIGHLDNSGDPGAICADGLTELSINQTIVEDSALQLRRLGYAVEILEQFDEQRQDYEASLVLEIHTIGCSDDGSSGYKVGYNDAPNKDMLRACLVDHYEGSTGLSSLQGEHNLSAVNPQSYVVDDISLTTPAALLSIGTLNADRDLILNNPERVVSGIVSTVTCFLPVSEYSDLYFNMAPMLIATQDIQPDEVITEDMLTVVLAPWDFMMAHQPPESSFMNVLSSPELAIGQRTNQLIRKYEPILMSKLCNAEDCTVINAENTNSERSDLIIATRQIALNEIITDDMVMSVSFDADEAWALAEENVGTWYYSQEDLVVGQQASRLIEAYEPISDKNIAPASICDRPCITLPDRRVAVALQATDRTPLFMTIGQEVDVLAAMRFVDVDDDLQAIASDVVAGINLDGDLQEIVNSADGLAGNADVQMIIAPTVTDAILLEVNEIEGSVVLTLAVYEQDAVVLSYMANANIPLSVVPHVETDGLTNNATASYAVAFPTSRIDSVSYGIQPDDHVNMTISNGSDNDLSLRDVVVLYIGDLPTTANVPQAITILGETNTQEDYIVIEVDADDYYLLSELSQSDSTTTISLQQISQSPITSPVKFTMVSAIGDLENEAIHLRNDAEQAIDVTGWTLQDEDGNVFTFGEMIMFAHSRHSIYTRQSENTAIASYWNLQSPVLEAGETIRLYDAEGNLQAQYVVPE